MFNKLKELFNSKPKAVGFDWAEGSYLVTPAIPALSEHQRIRRQLMVELLTGGFCNIELANESLAAFDKAFDKSIQLPRPDPAGMVSLEKIEQKLSAAGVKFHGWKEVI